MLSFISEMTCMCLAINYVRTCPNYALALPILNYFRSCMRSLAYERAGRK